MSTTHFRVENFSRRLTGECFDTVTGGHFPDLNCFIPRAGH